MQSKGFTLIELLITFMLLSILTVIAYPNYQHYIQRVHRQQAQLALMQLSSELTRYHFKYHTYQDVTLAMLNIPETIEQDYQIYIYKQTQNTYVISARPTFVDKECGTLSLNELQEKIVSGGNGVTYCW